MNRLTLFLWENVQFIPSAHHTHNPPNQLQVDLLLIHRLSSNACSETIEEYITKSRELIGELLKGISRSLGLEENFIHKRMDIESGSQLLVINFYPPCPKPELVMGLPAHTDHGLLTLLMQNKLGGLQIQHNGRWIPVHPLPNSFLINNGDHMEVNSLQFLFFANNLI